MSRRVLTIGTFDVPHLGHAYLFTQAAMLGDLMVGVNSDEFVARYKGAKPIFPYSQRATLIRSLGYDVIKNRSAGRQLIEEVQPEVLVIGSDWARQDYYAQIDVDQDWLDHRRIVMVYVPRIPGFSTTMIKERVRA